jgi:hypothetical protein
VLHVGGNYNQNQNHGLFYMNDNTASNTNANIGSRIHRNPGWLPVSTDEQFTVRRYGCRAPLGEDMPIKEWASTLRNPKRGKTH